MSEAKKLKKEVKSILVPSIQIEGHVNAFIPYFEEKQPTLRAVGFTGIPGTKDFVAYMVYIKGDKVEKIVIEEPNMRQIAEETAKINFVNEFIKDEEF